MLNKFYLYHNIIVCLLTIKYNVKSILSQKKTFISLLLDLLNIILSFKTWAQHSEQSSRRRHVKASLLHQLEHIPSLHEHILVFLHEKGTRMRERHKPAKTSAWDAGEDTRRSAKDASLYKRASNAMQTVRSGLRDRLEEAHRDDNKSGEVEGETRLRRLFGHSHATERLRRA